MNSYSHGTHALLDYYGCDAALLGDAGRLENILREFGLFFVIS